ncbi:MAG TPA: xanthine dehydrogenase family protein molybdopterin-binding subunit [Solirubrobacterales bacterium]|nr:xanthine dehydrogenase family protein molybdopterin-binding subunit [Solirubrobacterales bacterium]
MSAATRAETVTAPSETTEELGRWSGKSVRRTEDGRLLKGQGKFADDHWVHRQGFAQFVRSPHAHAKIVSIDTSKAMSLDGVFTVLTGEEAKEMCEVPFFQIAPEPGGKLQEWPLAVDKVRYHGDAVAVVLAETRELARDAAELVEVEYEPLEAIVDGVAAAESGAPVLHEEIGSNVAWQGTYDYGDIDWALENADHVVKIDRLHFHRFSSTPLECNAAVVDWDPGTGVVEVFSNNQMPMFGSMVIGPTLGVPSNKLIFSSQDIGGAFGIKIGSYPQLAALALLSKKAGRPAKWAESRSEHMLSAGHGNERSFVDIEVPVQSDGTILGFKVKAFDNAGAYLHYEPLGAVIWSQVTPGCYRMKHIRVDFTQTLTNKCPTIPNRGYSRLQHLWMIERIVDIVAQELDFDPVELRRRNYVQPEDYPYETPNRCVYDSGDLPRSLELALEAIDAPKWLERQRELGTGSGKRIGIGIGSTLDSGTNNFGQARIVNPELPFSGNGEAAYVKLDLYGEVNVNIGTTPQGQSHETTAAQVVADILNMDHGDVNVTAGFDQRHNTYVAFSGTYASQFAVTGLGAVMGAARKLRDEIITLAAYALEADEDEIVLENGACHVRDDPERAIPFIGLANMALSNNAVLTPELRERISLNCRYVYTPPFDVPDAETKTGNITLTYASQIHAAVVEIDEETGKLEILDYVAVDDCGRVINPQIVEGQVHGATALGIGAALYEAFDYDPSGQLQQSSFYEYHALTAPDMPMIKYADIESPSPFTPNGAKGMGEGGGAPLSTICSAIQDALGDRDAVVSDSHNPWWRIHELLRSGENGGPRGVEVSSR